MVIPQPEVVAYLLVIRENLPEAFCISQVIR